MCVLVLGGWGEGRKERGVGLGLCCWGWIRSRDLSFLLSFFCLLLGGRGIWFVVRMERRLGEELSTFFLRSGISDGKAGECMGFLRFGGYRVSALLVAGRAGGGLRGVFAFFLGKLGRGMGIGRVVSGG